MIRNSDNQTIDYPVRRVTTYKDMLTVATVFAKAARDKSNRFIALVYGRGGVGKTSLFLDGLDAIGLERITLDEDDQVTNGYHYFGSDISCFDMYTTLLVARNAPIVFDDTDSLLSQRDLRAKIKQICDTRTPTIVSYNKASVSTKSFATRSPVVVLLNDAPHDNPHVSAILDRFNEIIFFDPDKSEVLAYAAKKKIAKPKTIKLIRTIPIMPSLRTLVVFETNCNHYGIDVAIDLLLEAHSDKSGQESIAVKKIRPNAVEAMRVMESFKPEMWIKEFGKRIGKPIGSGKARKAENYAAVQREWSRVRDDAKSLLKAKRNAL